MESLFFERIKNLAGGRVYRDKAPAGAMTPYLTYKVAEGDRDWTVSGPSGSQRLAMRLNAWGATIEEASQLGASAYTLLTPSGSDFSCYKVEDVPLTDEESSIDLHSTAMKFSLIR